MIEQFCLSLGIPDSCYLGKRVFKKHFYENAELNKLEQKLFIDDIEDIQWRYSLKPETINIARYTDAETEYHEIAVLVVTLKNPAHYKRLASIIQKAIPYPLLLVFNYQALIALSVADKRLNRANSDKITVTANDETDWLDLSVLTEIEQGFISSMQLQNLSFYNFYRFYADWQQRIIAFNCAKITGRYVIKQATEQEQQRETLNAIRQAQQQLQALRAALKKESQFNQKVQLNIQIKQLDNQLQQLTLQL